MLGLLLFRIRQSAVEEIELTRVTPVPQWTQDGPDAPKHESNAFPISQLALVHGKNDQATKLIARNGSVILNSCFPLETATSQALAPLQNRLQSRCSRDGCPSYPIEP